MDSFARAQVARACAWVAVLPQAKPNLGINSVQELVKTGKVKYLGVSEVSPDQLRRVRTLPTHTVPSPETYSGTLNGQLRAPECQRRTTSQ